MFRPFKGRTAEPGQRIRMYRNLHNGLFSIKSKRTGLVLGHCEQIMLGNVDFVISKAGQKRARKEETRNVHAYAEGTIVNFEAAPSPLEINYNPFRDEGFMFEGIPLDHAAVVYGVDGRIYF